MHLAGLGQDTEVRSLLSWPLITGVARTCQRLPFQLSASVVVGKSGPVAGMWLPTAMQLAGRAHQIEVRLPAPPGFGVASTCHAVPSHRAVSGRETLRTSSLPTAMQLLPPVHETPVNSVIERPGSGLGCTVQAVPSHVAVRVCVRPRLR